MTGSNTRSQEQVWDSIEMPGRQRSVLSFHLSWAEAACCYGLGYLSRLFQHGYTYTSVDKVTNIFPVGKQLTLAK